MARTHRQSTTRLRVLPLALSLAVLSTTASCSGLNPLGFLTGGGTNVAANVQAGKTNTQTLGTTKVQESRTEFKDTTVERYEQTQDQENTVKTDSVQNLTVNEIPAWVILLLILGWLLPTPTEIARSFTDFVLRLFGRKR